MKKEFTVILAVMLVLPMVLSGCATGISQEQYDAVVTERDAARAQITDLQSKIADLDSQVKAATTAIDTAQGQIAELEEEIKELNAQIDELSMVLSVEEAWDRAQQRHTAIVQEIPFLDKLEEMAPWILFPDKPAWFDSARVCSTILADDPTAYEGVCIVTAGTQQMFVKLSDFGQVTTMICKGGSVDYEITMSRDENGKIIQEMMRAGESLIVIDWIDTGVEEILTANVNGEVFEAPWSEEADDVLMLFSDLATWLKSIDMDGGLIKPPDQSLVIIALGELRKPPYDTLSINWIEILQRAVSDFMQGVPQTCM